MDGFFWFMLGVATALVIVYFIMTISDIIPTPGERLMNKLLKQEPNSIELHNGYICLIYDKHTMCLDLSVFNNGNTATDDSNDNIYDIHIIEQETHHIKYVANNVLSIRIQNYIDVYLLLYQTTKKTDVIENTEYLSPDDILDKILRDGIESLSEKEREILDSQKNNG